MNFTKFNTHLILLIFALSYGYAMNINAKILASSNISQSNTITQLQMEQPITDNFRLDPQKEYKYYDIELILFKHNGSSGLNSEYWDIINEGDEFDIEEILSPQLAKYVYEKQKNKSSFIPKNDLVQEIDKKDYFLQKQADHIRYSKNYQILSHLSWRQPGLSKNEARSVYFPPSSEAGHPFGEIKIVLSRYLHAKINFNWIQEVCRESTEDNYYKDLNDQTIKVDVQTEEVKNPLSKENNKVDSKSTTEEMNPNKQVNLLCQQENIKFQQSRKMRSKVLHYIDHPVFGILIQINPVKKEETPK